MILLKLEYKRLVALLILLERGEAGYDSREKILDLVQDIQREIFQERQQKQ